MIDPKSYDYQLPPGLVAQLPASPRDASKLFIYNTKKDTIQIDTFRNVDKYLPKNSFLVLNETRVIPSRIVLYKENGGRVKTLFLVNELQSNEVKAMLDRAIEIGQYLNIDKKYYFKVISQNEHIFTLEIAFPKEQFMRLLEKKGSMPIPPYLKNSPLSEASLRKKYQTIFAKNKGSAAAPTASLHFTNRVLKKLEQKGIGKTFVILHVGAGTFAPLTEQQLKEGKLHIEWFEVPAKAAESISSYKSQGKKLIAVGTTVVRTLETAALGKPSIQPMSGDTDIFIHPPFKFKMVDALITNFHVPKSSLMMLVDAFLRHKNSKKSIQELYEIAIHNNLRFFSFGDAMLIV